MLRDRRSTGRMNIGSRRMKLNKGGFLSDRYRDYVFRTLFAGATRRKEPREILSRICKDAGLLALDLVRPKVVCVPKFTKIRLLIQFSRFKHTLFILHYLSAGRTSMIQGFSGATLYRSQGSLEEYLCLWGPIQLLRRISDLGSNFSLSRVPIGSVSMPGF